MITNITLYKKLTLEQQAFLRLMHHRQKWLHLPTSTLGS